MTRTRTSSGRALLIGMGLSSLLAATVAAASPARVLTLAPGIGGPKQKNGGPGNEQPVTTTLVHDGKQYALTVYMSSNVPSGDRPWQCKCSSVEMSPTAGPTVVADQVQLTHLDGNRPCNHPVAAGDGTDLAVWAFGSNDPNQATVQTYAGVIDYMCQEVARPIRISADANNNEGAADITFNGDGLFTAGYLSTGTNDRSIARGLRLNKGSSVTLSKTYLTTVVAPSNIGRPSIQPLSATRSLFCAAKGDQRPPEDGVQCALLDAQSGSVLWRDLIAESRPDDRVYMNQPMVALLGDGLAAVQVIESSGDGRRSDNKGASREHLFVFRPTDDGANVLTSASNFGAYQAHATLCSGAFDVDGQIHAAVFDASITGSGLAQMGFIKFDPTTARVSLISQQIVGSENGDSGYLANLYGQNPNTQGRDFMRCIGGVANPGFGVDGGFAPTVQSFFVAPYAGHRAGEDKNALFLSFMPGQTTAPPPPPPAGTNGIDETGTPTGTDPAAGTGDGAGAGSDPGAGDGTGVTEVPTSGGGCDAGGPASGAAGILLMLGVAALSLIRRRGR